MLEVIKYRGKEGMYSWALHRLTGLGIFFFLILHILEMSMIGYGPAMYNKALGLYHNNFFRFMEFNLGLTVFYHALNGTRIILMDFFDNLMSYYRQLFWVQMALFVIIALVMAVIMLKPIFL